MELISGESKSLNIFSQEPEADKMETVIDNDNTWPTFNGKLYDEITMKLTDDYGLTSDPWFNSQIVLNPTAQLNFPCDLETNEDNSKLDHGDQVLNRDEDILDMEEEYSLTTRAVDITSDKKEQIAYWIRFLQEEPTETLLTDDRHEDSQLVENPFEMLLSSQTHEDLADGIVCEEQEDPQIKYASVEVLNDEYLDASTGEWLPYIPCSEGANVSSHENFTSFPFWNKMMTSQPATVINHSDDQLSGKSIKPEMDKIVDETAPDEDNVETLTIIPQELAKNSSENQDHWHEIKVAINGLLIFSDGIPKIIKNGKIQIRRLFMTSEPGHYDMSNLPCDKTFLLEPFQFQHQGKHCASQTTSPNDSLEDYQKYPQQQIDSVQEMMVLINGSLTFLNGIPKIVSDGSIQVKTAYMAADWERNTSFIVEQDELFLLSPVTLSTSMSSVNAPPDSIMSVSHSVKHSHDEPEHPSTSHVLSDTEAEGACSVMFDTSASSPEPTPRLKRAGRPKIPREKIKAVADDPNLDPETRKIKLNNFSSAKSNDRKAEILAADKNKYGMEKTIKLRLFKRSIRNKAIITRLRSLINRLEGDYLYFA